MVQIFNRKDGTWKPVKCTAQTVWQHRIFLQMKGEESPTSQDNINCMEQVRHVKKPDRKLFISPLWLHETLPRNQRTVLESHLSGTKRNIVNVENIHFEKDSHYIYNSCNIVLLRPGCFRKCLFQFGNKGETRNIHKIYKNNILPDWKSGFVWNHQTDSDSYYVYLEIAWKFCFCL